MNYRHAFHAGNFADVFKHALLTRALLYLMRKPAPIRFIDTHAGIGRYDLEAEASARTGEWRAGIGRLAAAELPGGVRELLAPYLAAVGEADPLGRPHSYPGSPALAQALLRPEDRLALCELHPEDAAILEIAIGRDRRVSVLAQDGYIGLRALVPPPERRGLVLIDPPFEALGEFDRVGRALVEAHRKWPTGTYMVWYPVKERAAVTRFAEAIAASGLRRILQLHLAVAPIPRDGIGPLAACGLLVVNPPFGFKDEAGIILPALARALGGPQGSASVRVLVGE